MCRVWYACMYTRVPIKGTMTMTCTLFLVHCQHASQIRMAMRHSLLLATFLGSSWTDKIQQVGWMKPDSDTQCTAYHWMPGVDSVGSYLQPRAGLHSSTAGILEKRNVFIESTSCILSSKTQQELTLLFFHSIALDPSQRSPSPRLTSRSRS